MNIDPAIENYHAALLDAGMPEREAARAAVFAMAYGLDALNGPGCVAFDEPSCGDWNCIAPSHQRLSK